MPLIPQSEYVAPRWLVGADVQTVFPALCRKIPVNGIEQYKIITPDDDEFTIDLHRGGLAHSKGVVILSHGLEGNSRRPYMLGMASVFRRAGWDCIARNCRSCGGKMNKQPQMYHMGQTSDLALTVEWAVSRGYREIILIGFSLGGNQVLRYLGENSFLVPEKVAGAVVFSVPCDLVGSAAVLDSLRNKMYLAHFLKSLKEKVVEKHKHFPKLYPLDGLSRVSTFEEFDNRYTAPVHGFSSALDYWTKASSLQVLGAIKVRTLLINALNDPFLSRRCFPLEQAMMNPCLYVETPTQGGHVGFISFNSNGTYWSEQRALEFVQEREEIGY